MSQQVEIQRQYTVYEDDNGREYFLMPEGENVVRKVFLDEKKEQPAPVQNTSPEVIYIQNPNDDNSPPNDPNTVLLVPENQQFSPPPQQSYNYQDQNPGVIYIQSPSNSSGKLEPVKEEDAVEEPEVIYIQENPNENKEPETIYIRQQTPDPGDQEKQPIYVVLEDEPQQLKPRRYNHESPTERESYHRHPFDTSSSGPRTPRPYRPNKRHPHYKPTTLPEQQSTMSGGMLIIDNDPWEAKAKIDTSNPNYKRSGGNVNILHSPLNWHASPRIDANNKNYQRGGGDSKILSDKLSWDGKPKVDHVNPSYKRNGGDVLIFHENLKWRKNPKRGKHPREKAVDTSRSFSSEDVRVQSDSVSEDFVPNSARQTSPSPRLDAKQLYNYSQLSKQTGYAVKFKGKIHKTKGKDLPPLTEILPQTLPHTVVEKNRTHDKQPRKQVKEYSPRQSPEQKPPFRIPYKKEPIPPIITNKHEPNPDPFKQSKPTQYVLPTKTSLPWKDRNIEKVSAKTLEDISVNTTPSTNSKSRKPRITPYVGDLYYDTYGGNYSDNTGYYTDDYYTNDEDYDDQLQSTGYNKNHKDRESQRNNNKYTATQSKHHFPTRKRNEPVY